MINGPLVSVVCVVVDYFFNEKLCLVVLHAFLLMEQKIRKITNLGILVPLLQHIRDLIFLNNITLP
jgi:hypothetical protein